MRRRSFVVFAAITFGGAACGDDAPRTATAGATSSSSSQTTAPSTTSAETNAPATGVPAVVLRHLRRSSTRKGHAYNVDVQYAELSRVDAGVAAAANAALVT